MTHLVRHCGSDDSDLCTDGTAFLGHRHLASSTHEAIRPELEQEVLL